MKSLTAQNIRFVLGRGHLTSLQGRSLIHLAIFSVSHPAIHFRSSASQSLSLSFGWDFSRASPSPGSSCLPYRKDRIKWHFFR